MFQHGDAGWQNETILKQAVKSDPISNETESNTETNPINNKYLTANDFYAYMLHQRPGLSSILNQLNNKIKAFICF